MGKGTDKLYITHSEWASSDAHSASAGSGVSKSQVPDANFRRLPFNYCAASLQPFSHPVCTSDGTTFDITNILPWLKKHGTNPVDGTPLKSTELIKLNFAKNDDGEYVDPVTYKPFTDNTHLVALKNSGNVFSWDTVGRLNIKAKNWKDLVTDQDFSRKDIITLQDPQHLDSRDLSRFKYLQDGESTLTEEQEAERRDSTSNLNTSAMGSSAKILKAKEAVAKARAERAVDESDEHSLKPTNQRARTSDTSSLYASSKPIPYNAANYTTGKAAASFTSTGVSPYTGNERALLSEEDYMLKPRRVKHKGYARIQTSHGDINIELFPEFAPRAVWNFTRLAKKGYYRNIKFHRNIPSFMVQGGDPTGTGKGGQSIWGTPFADEYAQSPLSHNDRGIVSMANKGKNTNTSQFFITYRRTPHLDRKHTIFGKCINNDSGGESDATLRKLETVKTDANNRPTEDCFIEDIVVYLDPFEEFRKNKENQKNNEVDPATLDQSMGDDDNTTWTGKRVRQQDNSSVKSPEVGVGRYMASSGPASGNPREASETWDYSAHEEPVRKKPKAAKVGGFDDW